jgi:hypothetical protein
MVESLSSPSNNVGCFPAMKLVFDSYIHAFNIQSCHDMIIIVDEAIREKQIITPL